MHKNNYVKTYGKRNKSIKKRPCFSLILSFHLVIMLLTYMFGLPNNFVKADSVDKPVYIDSRIVKSGETLWSIAKSYDSVYYKNTKEYVDAIKKCNNLYSDEIYAGTSLIIPYTK